MPELVLADPAERDDLGAFVARAVRLDAQAVVRLRNRASGDLVDAWVATPFDTLATRTVAGSATPGDVTVSGTDLLTGLAVVRSETVDPGPSRDMMWRSALPPSANSCAIRAGAAMLRRPLIAPSAAAVMMTESFPFLPIWVCQQLGCRGRARRRR